MARLHFDIIFIICSENTNSAWEQDVKFVEKWTPKKQQKKKKIGAMLHVFRSHMLLLITDFFVDQMSRFKLFEF